MNSRIALALYALVWLSGDLLLQCFTSLPDKFYLSWLPLCILLCWFSPRARLPSIFALGFLWALFHAHVYFDRVLPESLAGEEIIVSGRVSDIPQQQGPSLRFDFTVETGALPSRQLRLAWYQHTHNTHPLPRAGESWRLKVKLKPPHGSSNPGGFDYEMWLYQRGVHATGYVRDAADNQLLADASIWSIAALRQQIAETIQSDARDYSGLLTALAVGYSGGIDSQQWDDLLFTGTNHLMSISGLHVSMVAGLVYWLMLRIIPVQLLRQHAAQPIAASAGLLAATLYAALAGFAIPTQRSLVMLAVVLGAVVLRRPLQPINTLAAALLAVLILDPLAVLAPGFWFSFMAVAIIAYGYAGRIGRGNVWWRFGRIHWIITLALFPLSLFLFQQSSVVAPLANFFMVPWVSLVVVPITLLGVVLAAPLPLLSHALYDLANSCLQLSWPALHAMAHWPMAKWVQPAPSFMALLLASCGVLLLLAPRGFPQRWLGGVMLLPALLISTPAPEPGEFRSTLIDVGQGLSVLVETQHHTLLFDTGPRYGDDADAGERLIVPFLRQQGIARLDKLMISNGDADHIGGAASILASLQVTEVTGQDINDLQHTHKTACATGQHWQWDGVGFYVLHPDQTDAKRNNYSCVLKISNGHESLLIAADIEKKIENRLLDTQADTLRSDVLIVPHHGSNTSSTDAFIAAVQPQYALVSAGYRSRFGHPRPEVVERYLDAGSVMINTAQAGAIELLFDTAPGLQPVLHRQLSRHYWNAPVK